MPALRRTPIRSPASRGALLSLAALAAGLACSSTVRTSSTDAGSTSPESISDGGARVTLGLSDLAILVPLETAGALPTAASVGLDGAPLVPATLFARVVSDGAGTPDVVERPDQFQLTSVRFDVCDRRAPGPCPDGSDGVLRTSFQPLAPSTQEALDVGLEAVFAVPADAMPALVADVRALAQVYGEPVSAPLQVSPALRADPTGLYARQLGALVMRSASASRLVRLQFLAQPDQGTFGWKARRLERHGPSFEPVPIPGTDAGEQKASVAGSRSYDVLPLIDDPPGIALAWQDDAFLTASPASQAEALTALVRTLDPRSTAESSTSCFACHTATFVLADRAAATGVDAGSLPGTYAAPHDLSIAAGHATSNAAFVRGLGWHGTTALISQRAVNEAAQALDELELRYPLR